MSNDTQTTLVVGGTGKTGRRVAARLAAQGRAVAVASRSGERAFDWHDEGTWGAALRGVGALYVAYSPDLAVPGADVHVQALARLAVERGVRRIVLLSGRGEPAAHRAERGVAASGAAFTVLRSAWFAQNFSEGHLLDPVRSGVIALPAGQVAEPFVDLDDLAEIAALALTGDSLAGQTLELTGPRLLTFAEAAAIIARAAGRPVAYVPVSAAEYEAALAPHLPAGEAAFLTELFSQILDGRNAHVTDDVARVLGRPARDLEAHAREAARAGVWR